MKEIKKTFATNLRALRKKQNITQEELADKFEIPFSIIELLESDATNNFAKKICRYKKGY